MNDRTMLLGLCVTLALLSGTGGATADLEGGEDNAGIQMPKAVPFQILVNHLGYDTRGSKRFVVQSAGEIELPCFQVLDGDGNVAFEGPLKKTGTVDGWKGRFFHQGDFSTLVKPGRYQIKVKDVHSERFLLGERLLPEACLSDLLYYFRIQRSSGVYDKADRALAFFGEPQRGRVDVHGGWFDASGDVSKYLSHLSEANYMNPQQTPMAVWCFMQSVDLLRTRKSQRLRSVIPLLHEEALYGADFLMRMQDPSGYFYMSVHDSCSKDPAQREICGYKGLSHAKHGETQAGIREGGGMAIAALARVSTLKQGGDFTSAQYLAAAEKGFLHLTRHNLEYVDDHQENIIDDYCGLLAATELYSVTTNPLYLQAARARAESLAGRLAKDERYAGWWRADAAGARPFFHAVDAGLPVVALCRYQQIETDAGRKAAAGMAVTESLRFELALTKEVANPFGYARQYIKDPDGKRGAFFMPHRNETGYWWSGENARLASLASAALLGRSCTPPEMTPELKAYAKNQVNWILGLNPYDLCMIQGKGRNNPVAYEGGAPNPPGGICNGITSGVEDEHDIAFLPAPYGQRGDWSWRWSEQWIPHASWMILALASETAADPVEGGRKTVLLDGTWNIAEGTMSDVPTDFGHKAIGLYTAIALLMGCNANAATAAGAPAGSSMITMDYARYLAPIDLHFTKPTQPIEGIPLGNGRMGTLVWIDGSGSKLQFNFGRPDVFYMGSATTTWTNKSHTDGNSKIGHVDIGFQGSPFASTCNQDLHAYDGYESIQGADVSVRIVPWRDRDVFAIEITDNRAAPTAITVDLARMMPDAVKGLYSNTSTQSQQNNRLILKQVFSEKCSTGMTVNDFQCASACVVAVQGRTATVTNGQLTIPAGKGTFTIYIGSAAAMTPKDDVVALANAEVTAAMATTFTAIFNSTTAQWHDFWKRSFIYLPATHDRPFDESFDQHWLYYLYGMNTCNRGRYPIHANGGIFNVQDGWQYWGSMYWWFNSSRQTLMPVFEQANHPELADPYFTMLSNQFPRINQAAIQQWGAGKDAIYIQETFGFDGPEVLPDIIAADLKNTFVNNAGQSPALDTFRKSRSEWESRWSMGGGSAGYHTHLLYNTAEAAQWYWERYEYTKDLAWLKDRAYPMIKGAAELYRTHPLTKLEADGFYHTNNLGWAETYRNGVRDGINDLASIHGIFPVAIKTAKLLNLDADLVPLWQEMLDKLAPYPTNATPQAMGVLQRAGEPVFAIGVGGHSSPGSDHDPRLMLVNVFDLVNTESKLTKPDEWQMALNTLAGLRQAKWIALNKNEGANGGGASPLARFCGEAARLGSVEWVKKCFSYQQSYWKTCKDAPTRWINRIREYNPEGGFALDWQQEATFSEGMSAALLQSGAAAPGGTPVIRVFPAWPNDTDASFTLRAKGDFMVTSMMKAGKVNFIEVTSQRGGPCTMRNYWGKQGVDLYRNNKKSESLPAELLTFATKPGETIVIVKSGTKPADFRVTFPQP